MSTVRDWSGPLAKVEAERRCRNWRECGNRADDPAHTIPRSLGGADRYDSVIPLCRGCHDKAHDHALEVLPLMNIAEQMEAVRVVGLERAHRILTRGRA